MINNTNPANMTISWFEEILELIKQLETFANVTNVNFLKPNEALTQAIELMRKVRSSLGRTHQSLKSLDSGKSDTLDPLGELIDALNAPRNVSRIAVFSIGNLVSSHRQRQLLGKCQNPSLLSCSSPETEMHALTLHHITTFLGMPTFTLTCLRVFSFPAIATSSILNCISGSRRA